MQASANSRLNPPGGKNLLSNFFKKDIRNILLKTSLTRLVLLALLETQHKLHVYAAESHGIAGLFNLEMDKILMET